MRGLFLILLVNRSASAVALPSDRSRASSNASALSRFGDPQLNVAPRLIGCERRLASLLFGESGQLLLDGCSDGAGQGFGGSARIAGGNDDGA